MLLLIYLAVRVYLWIFHLPARVSVRFDVDLFSEFFQGFVNHALMTLHIDNLKGKNSHHQIESVFKAFARALRMACEIDPRAENTIASTKR